MTLEELKALPVGSIVFMKYDDGSPNEPGEIIQTGRVVCIMWPESNVTNVIDTDSKAWQTFTEWLDAE